MTSYFEVASISFAETESFGTLASTKTRTGSISKSTGRSKSITPPGTLVVKNDAGSKPNLPRTPYPTDKDLAEKPVESPRTTSYDLLSAPRFWHGLYSPANASPQLCDHAINFPTMDIEVD
ncbi:hypothetical protein DSO57_1025820 [Entomophthora muscae]|uniref:Uncharacterized protein n=1 Tax=Entomophthora muscae TaxID=34485 RepID=A0ACC2UBB6_9FUNG|nr:hypothetical protein DSO57_1025820 [Entomophthora muscae]